MTDDYRVAKKQKESSTAYTYQRLPQYGAYRQGTQRAFPPHIGQQATPSQYPKLCAPQIYVHTSADAQLAAYKDAFITKAWHDEWQKAPEDFGPARPMVLLNQPARINLPRHALRTKDVHLNHWDCAHEPEGAKTQRQTLEQETAKKKEKMSVIEAMKQEQRRIMVKQAALNAQVIDLTDDDVPSASSLWMYHGVDNTENYPPVCNNRPWNYVEGMTDYDCFLSGLPFDMSVLNTNWDTMWGPQNGYSSQQSYGVS
ncbi:hypothetical protein L13192_07850 [Pyrenophora tritici-repentis]|uniref:Uncharacterized protein n=2 Tax=Pyrenophora tritici-repentis TaxID=45151 RepID=A0A922N843_9PLEO|nr:uncharacterized protein PTRG_05158 [Pyrenophora tritici-repentis Pt-1C-BFP]EDU48065.1 predicted protein [Pyrenophora tritici-repentis Pt-1C-BFP]KAI1509319.1 hypothetical protein Ptr86124_011859 [Pyrenophora tritici-repentis]KAI1668714.1 hypothetical protein L13192_07850 [Pyrenophora tritici-repentis]KAI1680461.1 hypothetical protein KJE20_09312 [Pyrenophora tritici-repentis]